MSVVSQVFPRRLARVGLALGVCGCLIQPVESLAFTPPSRTAAPDTSQCPQQLLPPPPVDTSEVPLPGSSSPTPPPIPTQPPGGKGLADCGVSEARGFNAPDDVLASSWIVFDIDSGAVLGAKDPHGRYRPASIIKVLLALVALQELDPQTPYVGTQEDANMEGSRVGIGPDGQYTVDQLLAGLVMSSGNDAAHALAHIMGGDDIANQKVNALAQKLGATSTYVANYSGLDGPGQMTTAFDMALIYRQAWLNKRFTELVTTQSVDFPGYQDNPGFQVWNDNGLLFNDDGSLGGKTGYTDDALHTYAGAVERDGRRLAVIILNTTIDKGRAWEQAQRLLDAGFNTPRDNKIGTVTPTPVGKEPTDPEAHSTTPTASPEREEAQQVAAPTSIAAKLNAGTPLIGYLVAAVVGILAVLALVANRRRTKKARAAVSPQPGRQRKR